MVDPGAAQVIVKHLNRWYRSKSRPRGVVDYYFRGTRMTFNRAYRAGNALLAGMMLAAGTLLFLMPDMLADKPLWQQWLVKLGWVGITVTALILLLQLFREFTVVNDNGLMKSNLWGRITRLDWNELAYFHYKIDENTITFRNNAHEKLTLSLCYNGWGDFMEMAARRMPPSLYWQVTCGLASVKANDQRQKSRKTGSGKKWFTFRRKK